MKRVLPLLTMLSAAVVLGACGGGDLVVRAQLEEDTAIAGTAGDAMALNNLEVYLLPYDRDVIFDSLSSAASSPEPEIPDSVLALQEAIAEAQQEWKEIESQWIVHRDSLQQISDEMNAMSREDPQYVALFRAFNDLEPEEQALSRQNDSAFQQFTNLQTQFSNATTEIRAQRSQWANGAFASVDSLINVRLDELDREEHVDTTDATGAVPFTDVPDGEWWIHARYELPYREVYWNVPVLIEGGDSVTIVLNRENGQMRPSL